MRPDEHLRDTTPSIEIVVADTSPLNYLVQVNCDFLLPLSYRRVIIPPAVVAELSHISAPQRVASWAASLPEWIEVLPVKTTPDVSLSFLGPGERDAIQLALEMGISTILIDEREGRQQARFRGLTIIGRICILVAGHQAGLINAQGAFDRLLNETTFARQRRYGKAFLMRSAL